jgi:hypothetical protein
MAVRDQTHPARRAAAPTMQPTSGSRGADPRNDLLRSISHKREQIETFLDSAASRRRLLLNLTIVAGTCSVTLTAAPALGGKSLADWLSATFALSSPSWQLLCAAAALCSLTATIATQLLKSHNLEDYIRRAQVVRAKLEMLEVGVASGELTRAQAAGEYMKCIEDSAWIEVTRRISTTSRSA